MAAKRRRMPDFTVDETRALVQKYVENFELLRAKQSTAAISGMKREVYEQITAAVNAVGVGGRSVDSVKDKWQTIKKNVKIKYQLYKQQTASEGKFIKTEDGFPEAINTTAFEDWETQLINILPLDQLEAVQTECYNDTFTDSPNTTTPECMQEIVTEGENGIPNEIAMCDTSDDLPSTQIYPHLAKPISTPSASPYRKKEKKSTTKDTDELTSSSYYSRMIAIEEEKLAVHKEMYNLKKWYYDQKIELLKQQQQQQQWTHKRPLPQSQPQLQQQPQLQLLQKPQQPKSLNESGNFLKIPIDG